MDRRPNGNTVNTVGPEDGSYLVSTSLKNETRSHEDSSFTMSTSLKNETNPLFKIQR